MYEQFIKEEVETRKESVRSGDGILIQLQNIVKYLSPDQVYENEEDGVYMSYRCFAQRAQAEKHLEKHIKDKSEVGKYVIRLMEAGKKEEKKDAVGAMEEKLKTFACSVCGKEFKTPQGANLHKLKAHKKE